MAGRMCVQVHLSSAATTCTVVCFTPAACAAELTARSTSPTCVGMCKSTGRWQ
jgi:hypothetical protein